jgi:hypothetical protein
MVESLWSLGAALCLLVAEARPEGYLVSRSEGVEKVSSYMPREGDLIFYDDHKPIWNLLFAYAGTGAPLHVGIVVKKTDGRLAVLEAGPDDTIWVNLIDLVPRLQHFRGTITIRGCKKTLTPAESRALTKFAFLQDGKRYAILRLLLQGTWLRVRGPLEPFLARTHLDRDSWICSELAVAAGTVAGLFDPREVHSNVCYPRDLVDNRRHDLGAVWNEAATWRATAQRSARDTSR